MSEWQPIETAPKDGTWFVTVSEDGEYEVGCYDPSRFYTYEDAGDGLFKRFERIGYEWRGFSNIHRAIAWMPLPARPETQSER